MNTTGNSSPFALCSVISVTASASGPSLSSSATSMAFCRKSSSGRARHGNSGLAGGESQLLDRRFAKSTPRHDDGPTERLVVRGIGNELEVAHQVADFAAIVEPYRTDQPVRHGALSQCLLHRAAL